jgi:hypothetical protein
VVLADLVAAQFLRRTSAGMYARSSAAPYSRQLRATPRLGLHRPARTA